MECTSEKCKRKLRKRLQILHGSISVSSESSLSSDSETHFRPLHSLSRKRKKASCDSKRDYLSRLFERKKLKDKSLSKKLRTPFDRKINRTCWPIELSKVSRIKKKPREKRREKPTHRSLTKRKYSDSLFLSIYRENSSQITCSELELLDDDSRMKFSDPLFISCYRGNSPQIKCTDLKIVEDNSFRCRMHSSNPKFLSKHRAISPPAIDLKVIKGDSWSFRNKLLNPKFFSQYKASSPNITCSELEFLNDDSFCTVYQYLSRKPFTSGQVTPEMLLEVLRDPEYLETGATIDIIIKKIRILNVNLNPEVDLLKEEVAVKLMWAIAMGLITEENGFFKASEAFQKEKWPKKKIRLIWDWWYHRMQKIRI